MTKSNTKIEKQLEKKVNPKLVETVRIAKKNNKWKDAARVLSGSRKNRIEINLSEINQKAKDGERIVIFGKVLSQGEINKKIEIISFNFSEKAKEKLLKNNCKAITLLEEIKKNPEAKGVRFLK